MRRIDRIPLWLGGLLCAAISMLVPASRAHALDSATYLGITRDIRGRLMSAGMRTAYAIGDFDGNGVNDLAIGIPYATVANQRAAGKVVVIYGDASGLLTPGRPTPSTITYSSGAPLGPRRIPGFNLSGDLTGFSLAAGDFNRDGIDDLAVGAPGADVLDIHDANQIRLRDVGAVFVGHGVRNAGLDFREPVFVYWQGDANTMSGRFNLPGEAEDGDLVGFSLAAGDFNGDHYDDLAIGVPGENINRAGERRTDAGVVIVLAGGAEGLDATTYGSEFQQHPDANRYHFAGRSEDGDLLGFSLAAGDFNGDGYDDLAIGVPGEDDRTGGVNVAKGTATGLSALSVEQMLQQGGEGHLDLPGNAQAGALVGFSLAAGDFNGDGRWDLAIGAPGRSVAGHPNAGSVLVAHGHQDGPGALWILDGLAYSQEFTQSAVGNYDLPGTAQDDDLVGFSLAAADFNYTPQLPRDDLAIGAPGEDGDAGAVMVRYGSGTGGLASAQEPHLFTQSRNNEAEDLVGAAEAGDLLGLSLAAGRFGVDMPAELVIAAPGERVANNSTQPFPLPAGMDQMLVDGYTSVIFGEAESGPTAAVERQFWSNRFVVGGWAPRSTVLTQVLAGIDQAITQAEADSLVSINLYRGTVRFTTNLAGTGQADTLGADFALSLEIALLPDPSVDVSTAISFAPAAGGITATAPFQVSVGFVSIRSTVRRTIPVLPGINFTRVILLPDQSLEVILTPNPS
jgi:hypothetical protein